MNTKKYIAVTTAVVFVCMTTACSTHTVTDSSTDASAGASQVAGSENSTGTLILGYALGAVIGVALASAITGDDD